MGTDELSSKANYSHFTKFLQAAEERQGDGDFCWEILQICWELETSIAETLKHPFLDKIKIPKCSDPSYGKTVVSIGSLSQTLQEWEMVNRYPSWKKTNISPEN